MVTEKKVLDYLKKNPDFFIRNSSLLQRLEFPDNNQVGLESKDVISFRDWLYNSLKKNYKQILLNAKHNFFTQKIILDQVLKILQIDNISNFKKFISNEICKALKIECFFLFSSSKNIENFGGFFLEERYLDLIYQEEGRLIMDSAYNEINIDKFIHPMKISSSAILSLDYKLFNSPLVMFFGSEEKIFLQNKGTELLIFFGSIFQEKLKQLMHE